MNDVADNQPQASEPDSTVTTAFLEAIDDLRMGLGDMARDLKKGQGLVGDGFVRATAALAELELLYDDVKDFERTFHEHATEQLRKREANVDESAGAS